MLEFAVALQTEFASRHDLMTVTDSGNCKKIMMTLTKQLFSMWICHIWLILDLLWSVHPWSQLLKSKFRVLMGTFMPLLQTVERDAVKVPGQTQTGDVVVHGGRLNPRATGRSIVRLF